MKKINLLILTLFCSISLCAFADNNCNTPCPKPCDKPAPCSTPAPAPCEKKMYTRPCPTETFLCTNKDKDCLFETAGLSETQICTANKIQDKYELEVLSINERIKCEEENLNTLKRNCAKSSDIRKQKNVIKDLKEERREICKCYENQFKDILSSEQWRAYKNAKKQ